MNKLIEFVVGFLLGVLLVVPAVFLLRAAEGYFGREIALLAISGILVSLAPEVCRFVSAVCRRDETESA